MRIESWQCDGCGKQKGVTNHWLLVRPQSDAFMVFPWNEEAAVREESREAAYYQHLCGSACVTKKLSAWLGAQQNQPVVVADKE